MGWFHPTLWDPYSLRECLQIINIKKTPPADLVLFFFLHLSVVPSVWPVFGLFSGPGIYVETYVYDDVYV